MLSANIDLSKTNLDSKAHLFPVKTALLYVPADPLGLEGTGFQGHNMWAADNPSFGANFYLHVKDEHKTLKTARQEKEKALEKKGAEVLYPSFDELRKEDAEVKAQLIWTITDANGKQIRRMTSSPEKGLNKLTWDLRATSTNPIAVGDEVVFEMEDEAENRTIITELTPRRNYVNRISPANKRQHHIIASNLDQSLLIATIKDPRTSIGFIDRFLVTCEAFHIPAIVVFNKSDLHEEHETAVYEERKAIYEKVGYRVLLTSVEEEKGLDVLKETLYGKTTLISGHSGVGKSSIINAILWQKISISQLLSQVVKLSIRKSLKA